MTWTDKTTHVARFLVILLVLPLVLAACGGTEEDDPSRACRDGVLGAGETDIDCGGFCSPCLDGQACERGEDCSGGVCADGVCTGPSCTDGSRNGDESDVDCGGSCDPCGAGAACEGAEDCTSGACADGLCVVAESCTDGSANQDETDVDCGGSCPACSNGRSCSTGADCTSGHCNPLGRCEPAPTCTDGSRNGGETDVDCGGPDCPACEDDRTCEAAADCVSGVCFDGLCGEPPKVALCSNATQDGEETDVDCGGPDCGPCPAGYACGANSDCGSGSFPGVCADGICGGLQVCQDGAENGHETDLDCGGPYCLPCFGGEACEADQDCASGTCLNGACTDPPDTCDNGVKDGFESDTDCGGNCPPCDLGYFCDRHRDCGDDFGCHAEGPLQITVCGGALSCGDGQQNGHETDTDCGSPVCLPCGDGQACVENVNCASGTCADGTCAAYAATCGDGTLNGTETDLDCGGAACVPCADGKTCLVPSDCESYACAGGRSGGSCEVTAVSLQRSASSMACTSYGQSTVVSTGHAFQVVVASPALQPEPGTDGYYVVPSVTWSPPDRAYMGLLLTFDSALGLAPAMGDVLDIVGDHVEVDCMTRLHASQVTPGGPPVPLADPVDIDPALLAQGGISDAEPWEGVLVRVTRQNLAATSGSDAWWFNVGNGIQVADGFGLADSMTLPSLGTPMTVTGILRERGGVYSIVPRDATEITAGAPVVPR